MHFPTSSANHGALDDWGQVQPSSDPALKPRVVHRGLDGLPDIPDSECEEVDHLCFLVHGIGSACDMRFRSIFEVVDTYRDLTGNISAKHFAGAHLASSANRVEFLPVDWHSKLHREDEGTDNRLKPLTLRSVPKLRSFVNDTLLDVLFYTSPVYCQTILDTVCSEINKVYKLFKDRNPDFSGGVSLIGHSLGSLILFDLLSGQPRTEEEEVKDILEGEEDPGAQDLNDSFKVPVKPRWDSELSLEEVFSKLEISEYTQTFINQGISMDELAACSEEDLKEAELPLGPRKKLINFMRRRNESGFQEFQNSAVRSRVDYTVGPAGTGQPFVRYPRLDIKPEAFFAFGSPIGMFMAVRGIQSLGPDFKFPTCDRFFNIFHPYDPVAYRIESLVGHEYSDLRPVLIPHHKGRKRMHLELKETMSRMGTDIKQKFMDSLKAVYSMAGTLTGSQAEQTVEEMVDDRESISPTQECEGGLTAELNKGRRIDYVLQEAPMESFNEYLWSLASHLCYWSSEDTALMVLKEIYNLRNVYPDDRFGEGTQSRTVQPGTETYSSNSTYSAPPTFTPAPPSISVPPTFPSYSSPPSFQPMTPFPPISSTGFSGTPTIGYSATPTTGYSATPTTGYNATPTTGYSATPTTGYTATPTTGYNATPTTGYSATPTSGYSATPTSGYSATPTSGYSATPTIGYSATPTIGYSPTPTPVSIPSGPPPTFFSPASIPVAPVSSTTRSLIYPRPVGTGTGTGGPGMDPTAPVETDKPIPPPPKMAGGMMQ
ncbi:phospholipase DDHD2 [Eurytemora carolleeae]|uniref:phospholipase DDHD2 n=1 Tax=Eurytemora carolleeae TaxID=1294199 RepID=UPI000C781142|nr:phospholipase DDHD2 [Eurytemora carolleeae]|eukprot:XP_023341735.1 phospholipase DDHD2-like [Eurytemora affinis]